MDAGISLAGGSDHGVFFSPLLHIWWYVTRQTRDSGVLGIEHAITSKDALILATKNPPYLTSEESLKGTIEPNKFADLIVLEADPQEVLPSDIRDIKVIATIVGGRWVTATGVPVGPDGRGTLVGLATWADGPLRKDIVRIVLNVQVDN